MQTRAHTCAHKHACTHKTLHLYTQTYTYITHAHTDTHTHIYTTNKYIQTPTQTYTCTHINIHTHAYKHTYTHNFNEKKIPGLVEFSINFVTFIWLMLEHIFQVLENWGDIWSLKWKTVRTSPDALYPGSYLCDTVGLQNHLWVPFCDAGSRCAMLITSLRWELCKSLLTYAKCYWLRLCSCTLSIEDSTHFTDIDQL